MDFITWPELILSILAVLAVFTAATGVMILFATQLTQDDSSFFFGIAVPLVLASYFRGWEAMGIWVLLTVFAMLASRGKGIHWILGFLGISIIGIGSILLYDQIAGKPGVMLLLPLPWFVICGGIMWMLKWDWPRWSRWLLVVFGPALLLFVLALGFGEDAWMVRGLQWIYLIAALALATITPIRLAQKQPEDCGRSIRLALALTGGGSVVVMAMFLVHNLYFVR